MKSTKANSVAATLFLFLVLGLLAWGLWQSRPVQAQKRAPALRYDEIKRTAERQMQWIESQDQLINERILKLERATWI